MKGQKCGMACPCNNENKWCSTFPQSKKVAKEIPIRKERCKNRDMRDVARSGKWFIVIKKRESTVVFKMKVPTYEDAIRIRDEYERGMYESKSDQHKYNAFT